MAHAALLRAVLQYSPKSGLSVYAYEQGTIVSPPSLCMYVPEQSTDMSDAWGFTRAVSIYRMHVTSGDAVLRGRSRLCFATAQAESVKINFLQWQ